MVDVMMSVMITSMVIAVVVPRLTSTKRQARATAIMNDFRTFGAAFDGHAQEMGAYPAEVGVAEMPAAMAGRMNQETWSRETPIGGQYNFDNDQTHYGTRYKAVIAVNGTTAFPLEQDVELWEVIDQMLDDGNLMSGSFRLGAGNEPIYVLSR